jgi:hypothetical protein
MGDRVGDQCLFVETEEKDGDLHCSNGAFLEKLWEALCVMIWIKIKTWVFYAFERHCSLHTVQM